MVSDGEVISWYNAGWNKKGKRQITIDTSLNIYGENWEWEEGMEIMDNYAETFNVDMTEFNFIKYWPDESSILLLLCCCGCGIDDDEPEPLTLKMLAESARAGKWLYI